MASRKKYCSNDCDYTRYYLNQAGSGLSDIRVFQGYPYQRGYGLGTTLKRFGIPLLKFLGRHFLSTGMSIGSDLLANKPIKESVKQRVKENSKLAAKDGLSKLSSLIDQAGSGRLYKKKTRKVIRKTPVLKRKKIAKKDIFG